MLRLFGFVLVVIGTFGMSSHFLETKIPQWKTTTKKLLDQATLARVDVLAWEALVIESHDQLPDIYPFTVVQGLLEQARDRVVALQDFRQNFQFSFDFESGVIDLDQLYVLLDFVKENREALQTALRDIYRFPDILIPEQEMSKMNLEIAFLEHLVRQMKDLEKLQPLLRQFGKDQDRVLLLLQNQNEPRPTGGFAGSFVIFDFSENQVLWDFADIYSLDRLVPLSAQEKAPDFFQGLSSTISLRDANFDPHFPKSAKRYQRLFESAGQRVPDTVMAVNLNIIERLMSLSGPILLEKWDLVLQPYNFDLLLQFLVESKIAGRYEVKTPVEDFARELVKALPESDITWHDLGTLEMQDFLAQKNILAYSQHRSLQRLFESWDIAGLVRKKRESNNVLMFDFVSVGANKSEKFVWTKLDHNSAISPRGLVTNTLKIRRTHALRAGELNALIEREKMAPNIAALLDSDLIWKLGAGQNRTILRLMVPKEARLLKTKNPSGVTRVYESEMKDFQIFEIPLFVERGESLEVELVYQTQIDRGSSNWRPYHLQLLGTPGRAKTELMATISTTDNGTFKAETLNVGRPTILVDQDFKTVIEWE